MKTLPNALIIGVQKASTSWLSARLAQHPDAHVVPGEIHYFDRASNYDRGPEWYADRFSKAGSSRIRLDKTGAYFWTTCEDVENEPQDKPERIKALIPDAKMIVMLRDPVSRAYSAWNHIVRAGRVRARGAAPDLLAPDIAADIHKHGVLTRGLYHAQLKRYLEFFPRDQILVLFQEHDVIASPEAGIAKTCRFLGLDPDFTFSELDTADNRFDGTLIGNRLTVASPVALHQLTHRLDRYLLARLPFAKLPYPKGDAETRAKLADYYLDDCRKLQDLVGPLPANWIEGRLAN